MYQALYRKYRPVDFDSVVGQDSIIKTLRNSVINNNFSHAYLFYGSRGTGKTSVSKIFARNINCLNPVNGNACGKCDACKVSFSKECVDIIEIDAASNNGVDEIRELKSNINLVPADLKYKVYIVDEVHMLSDSAFNALLKTLEEPPSHVVFILATTDPQKVPDTIVSRCQCFSFKKLSENVILQRLEYVCKNEKIKIDSDVLRKISLLCDGGLRDALGSLDKLVSYNSSNITIDDFNEINGIISDDDVSKFISNVFDGKIKDSLNNINNFNNCGKNLIQIIIQIIDFCRSVIINHYIENKDSNYSIDLYQNFIILLNEKLPDFKKSDNTRIYFEMFILKFINEYIIHDLSKKTIVEKNNSESKNVVSDKKQENITDNTKENKIDNAKVSIDIINQYEEENNEINNKSLKNDTDLDHNKIHNIEIDDNPKILNLSDINNVRINNTFATAEKQLLLDEQNNFELLKEYSFDQEIGYIVNSILDSTLRVVGKNNLIISYESDGLLKQNLNNYILINDVYNKITKSNKNIAIVSDEEWNVLKDEYVKNLKEKHKYQIQEEPKVLFEETKKNDIIMNDAISLFGDDIVEFE